MFKTDHICHFVMQFITLHNRVHQHVVTSQQNDVKQSKSAKTKLIVIINIIHENVHNTICNT